jgi:hypothetical protein
MTSFRQIEAHQSTDGTPANNEDPECQAVLDYSLHRHASLPLDITWMGVVARPDKSLVLRAEDAKRLEHANMGDTFLGTALGDTGGLQFRRTCYLHG